MTDLGNAKGGVGHGKTQMDPPLENGKSPTTARKGEGGLERVRSALLQRQRQTL